MFEKFLERLTVCSVCSCYSLNFIAVKIHSWITGEKTQGKVWKNPCAGFLMLSPSFEGPHRAHSSPSNENETTCVWLETQSLKNLLGDGYVDTIWLAHAKTPGSQKAGKHKKSSSTDHVIGKNCVDRVDHLYYFGNSSSGRCPAASHRTTLQASHTKESSLRSVMLTLYFILSLYNN